VLAALPQAENPLIKPPEAIEVFDMTCSAFSRFSLRRAVVMACSVALLCGVALQQASARSGPFAGFSGHWSGGGIIRVRGQDSNTTERIRCSGSYRERGGYDVELQLSCRSDTYNFDLTGNFQADSRGRVNGQWTERTRGVSGSAYGRARDGRLQVHAESPALTANLSMYTRGRRQSVSLNAAGGGQQVSASISLRRY
jgi:hypothetical protein